MAGALVFEKVVTEDLDIGDGEVDVTHPAGGLIRGTQINIASFAFATYENTWSPGAVPAQGSTSTSISTGMSGVRARDYAVAWHQDVTSGALMLKAEAHNDSVTVTYANGTAGAINPGSGTLRIMVFKTNL